MQLSGRLGGFRVKYIRRPATGASMCRHGARLRPSRTADHHGCRSMGLGSVRDCLLTRCRMLMNVYRENKKCFHLQQGHEGQGLEDSPKHLPTTAHAACRYVAEHIPAQHAP